LKTEFTLRHAKLAVIVRAASETLGVEVQRLNNKAKVHRTNNRRDGTS